jgi:hypothetical protein
LHRQIEILDERFDRSAVGDFHFAPVQNNPHRKSLTGRSARIKASRVCRVIGRENEENYEV